MTNSNLFLQRKSGQLKKHVDIVLDREDKKNARAKKELQKRDDNVETKKKKSALTPKDNNERSKKQSQKNMTGIWQYLGGASYGAGGGKLYIYLFH